MRHFSAAFIVPIVWYNSVCQQRTTESCVRVAISIRRDNSDTRTSTGVRIPITSSDQQQIPFDDGSTSSRRRYHHRDNNVETRTTAASSRGSSSSSSYNNRGNNSASSYYGRPNSSASGNADGFSSSADHHHRVGIKEHGSYSGGVMQKLAVLDAEVESFTSNGSREELLAWQAQRLAKHRNRYENNKKTTNNAAGYSSARRQSKERTNRNVYEATASTAVRKERVLSANARREDFENNNSFSSAPRRGNNDGDRWTGNNRSAAADDMKSSPFVAASTSPSTVIDESTGRKKLFVNNSGSLPSLMRRTSEKQETTKQDELSITQAALRDEYRKQTTAMAHEPSFRKPVKKAWDESIPITIKGDCLKTWSYRTSLERVLVSLTTNGGPLDADIQLWQGPDNSPCAIRSFVGNGDLRPFNCVIETPGTLNTVAIRNRANEEYPMKASVISKGVHNPFAQPPEELEDSIVEAGGDSRSFPFEDIVRNVRVFLRTDGRPLNARVELVQGENVVQAFEISVEDGKARPFCAVIETPGVENIVRIVNTAPVDFPLHAWAQPCELDERRKRAEAFNREVVDTEHEHEHEHENENEWDYD
mmetsp:Transcript_6344/g.9248  ORF Transcript_6344/g.9248 Transcript_6344/m.9248 type:complete len:592 (+) Transcript_6344:155-1930(+)|eukprot:CAMPEP_0196811226 /NCGR_PEP_ID=MMETSP1362-20130617/17021_1 /TAXON_ID=163516 /ORGANISM="Leptocylindrus danicus, Strain CCMP1856" /LENGTH=591 /DNA_ID=CAMNT_0042186495 /DNA_START=118 /DNA_END=1893 /DNA_ORIENTATION=-